MNLFQDYYFFYILNYHFITKSDTEVLIAGYILWCIEKLISKINGMFAFVILDKNTGEIISSSNILKIFKRKIQKLIEGKKNKK